MFLNPDSKLKSSENFEKLLMPWFEARSIKSKLWYESGHDFFFFVSAFAADYLQDVENH